MALNVPQKTALPPRGETVGPRLLGDNRGQQQQTRPYGADDTFADRALGETRSLLGDNPRPARSYATADDSYVGRGLGDSRVPKQQIRPYGAGRGLQQGRGYGTSDENVLRKQILDTHESDDRLFAVKPVLHIVEVIFHRASSDVPGSAGSLLEVEAVDEKALHAGLQDMIELPTRIISTINCEIFCKWLGGGDVHNTTMDILHLVKHYNWDAKAVLAVAALSVSYGEFRLVATLYGINPMAKAVALLKQLPEILELQGSLKAKLDGLFNLVRSSVDVTQIIYEFYELHRDDYFSPESPEAKAFSVLIPTAVYWVIRSTVICASQIMGLTGMGHEYISESWELSSLAHKLSTIHSHLLDQLKRCYNSIESKRDEASFAAVSIILEQAHLDNSKPLRTLFLAKDDLPLYDCHEKRKISIDELRRKVVVLFITSLDIPQEDYTVIHQMYQEKRAYPLKSESQYEIVWIPIEDSWTIEKYQMFESLKQQMDWHTVHHPTVVPSVVAKYIRHPEKWRFNKKPIFVVLDTQGKVVHKNSFHMMCVWGSVAYPFSEHKERILWEEETWRMDFLVDSIDTRLTSWIQAGKYVCLFGGEDIEWMRRFTRAIKEAARDSGISLELLYVGKTKPKEKTMNEINAIIEAEKMGSTIDYSYIWYFWLRLESMWYSKGQILAGRKESMKSDPIMQGIIALLSFGSGTTGWAVVSRGSLDMTKGNGIVMHTAVSEHANWKPRENDIGFVPALDEYLTVLHSRIPHPCTSLILPATGAMPETVSCAECGRIMERFTMFRCCSD
ncbi:hypothetical protein FNV43_RR25885 [Rhamnella rubrinervis]|uniref:Sieve element occlusion n=1 Tax=Rhamnella rubrinervis TaxID=2594499 RepID=A0A8K0GQY6_9ROSA|nr:hypothetical protein FNV43_RR25885 [Rhamnella rubrinervis]